MTAILAAVGLGVTVGVTSPAHAATTHPDYISLLVGSPHAAVYELTHDPNTGTVPPAAAPYELVVRAADGSSEQYPLSPDQKSLMRWSLSQSMLTAVNAADPTTVDWWDLAARASGTLTVPKHGYVSASPHGVLLLTKNGTLKERTPAGVTTVLSRPFATHPTAMSGCSNDDGVLIGDYPGQARYLTFTQPARVHRLKTGDSRTVVCDALGASYAACTTRGTAGGRPTDAALLSLTGKSPVFADDRRENFGAVGLIGTKTVAWTRFHDTNGTADHGPDSTVASLTRGKSHPAIAKGINVAFGQMITAYGEILVMPKMRHRIFASDDGKTFTTIVTAPSS